MKVGLLFFRRRLREGQLVPGWLLGAWGQWPPLGDTWAPLAWPPRGQLGQTLSSESLVKVRETPKSREALSDLSHGLFLPS